MVTEVSCPICRKKVPFEGNPYRPFCSQQCRMRDLGAWASEEYRVEGKEDESEDLEEEKDNGGGG